MRYANFAISSKKVQLLPSEINGLIVIKFAQDVAQILPLNIFESEWRCCNPFWNDTVSNKRRYQNFAIKLVAMATSLEESEKEVQIDYLQTNTYHLVKKHENQSTES